MTLQALALRQSERRKANHSKYQFLLPSYISNVKLISSLMRNFPPTILLQIKPFQSF